MARRRRSGGLVASAAQVKLGNHTAAQKLLRSRENWQGEAWDYFDDIGELKYGANFLANAIARLRLFVGIRPAPEADPVPLSKLKGPEVPGGAEQAEDALARIQSPFGGHADLLRVGALNLTVAGEFFLIGRTKIENAAEEPDDPSLTRVADQWEARSVDELEARADGKYLLKSDGFEPDLLIDGTTAFVLRIWQSHPRFRNKPDSPVRGVRSACEELLLLEKAARALTRSRPGSAGLLLVPDELSFGPVDPSTSEGADPKQDPLLKDLIDSMVTPIRDEDSAAAIVPMLVKGKAEFLKEMRHLSLERPFDEMIEKRTDRALRRLAQGINLPVEVLLGMGDLNHWSAWLVDESNFKAHIEPLAATLMEGLTVGYLHAAMAADEESPIEAVDNPFVIWYDPASLVVRPNRSSDATEGVKLGAIGLKKWREVNNFEEADAPTPEELDVISRMQGRKPGETDTTGERNPPDREGVQASASRKPLGDRLASIDSSLRHRLYAASDAAFHRSLERAGSVLASRANRNSTARALVSAVVDRTTVAAALGPSLVADIAGGDVDDMLQPPLQALQPKFEAWAAAAATQMLSLLPRLTDSQREMYELEFEQHRAEAWGLMMMSLLSLARARLFDPSPEAPAVGEVVVAASVPFGLIRESVARAGGAGAHGLERVGAAVMVGGEPAGGVATGSTARSALAATGHEVEGWRWEYGDFPRSRPFEPHRKLDGLEFNTWTDERLHNSSGWPHVEWFVPGDHEGCVCDFAPIINQRR